MGQGQLFHSDKVTVHQGCGLEVARAVRGLPGGTYCSSLLLRGCHSQPKSAQNNLSLWAFISLCKDIYMLSQTIS